MLSATTPPSALPGISPTGGEIANLARRAAILAKADLQTEVVGEFPELQGAMGRKYALLQGEHASVAAAIEEHYRPQGPSDRVPTDPVSVAVALADKLDTLVGFWAIDEKPTGQQGPVCAETGGAGRDPDRGGEWGAAELTRSPVTLHIRCCFLSTLMRSMVNSPRVRRVERHGSQAVLSEHLIRGELEVAGGDPTPEVGVIRHQTDTRN